MTYEEYLKQSWPFWLAEKLAWLFLWPFLLAGWFFELCIRLTHHPTRLGMWNEANTQWFVGQWLVRRGIGPKLWGAKRGWLDNFMFLGKTK